MNDPFAELAERFHLVTSPHVVGDHELVMRHPRSVDELIDEAAFEADERLPYWADIWPSSRILAERIAGEKAQASGRPRRLLELGCGVGFASLVAAQVGFDALATDYTPEALEFVAANAHHNGLDRVTTRLVDWRALPDDLGKFDVVCAADVLYERHMPALIAEVFSRTLSPDGLGIVTDPGRQRAQSLAGCCREQRLDARHVDRRPAMYGKTPMHVDIYEIRHLATDP